jgi:hypothetical protein
MPSLEVMRYRDSNGIEEADLMKCGLGAIKGTPALLFYRYIYLCTLSAAGETKRESHVLL